MGRLTIEFKYGFGDTVYLKTDVDQIPRMVLQVSAAPKENIQYQLGSGDRSSWHYEIEITDKKDVLASTIN